MTSKKPVRPFDSSSRDDQNLLLATTTVSVEQELSDFYSRFPYPWRPSKFESLADPSFEIAMLNQNIGDFQHKTVPQQPIIWVAGCGTNQALITALRFTEASVLGSDLSSKSLEICSQNGRALGVKNLELENRSINRISYTEQFDYIICTGVIHHNADPMIPLRRIAQALKPTGILELMVYNRFHRTTTSVFQKAVRLINGSSDESNLESDLDTARKLIENLPAKNALYNSLGFRRQQEEAPFADGLIHPVEHSYTVETLEEMAEACGLELMLPCINQFDALDNRYEWNLQFEESDLRQRYNNLPDSLRWQITNLLLFEQSPLLWFYLQRKDAGRRRKTEKEVCGEFLDTRLIKAGTFQSIFLSSGDGRYTLSPKRMPYPAIPPNPAVRAIYDAVDGCVSIKEILESLGIEPTFEKVNLIRMFLSTATFPYLRAVSANEPSGPRTSLKRFESDSITDSGGLPAEANGERLRMAVEQISFEGDDADEREEY